MDKAKEILKILHNVRDVKPSDLRRAERIISDEPEPKRFLWLLSHPEDDSNCMIRAENEVVARDIAFEELDGTDWLDPDKVYCEKVPQSGKESLILWSLEGLRETTKRGKIKAENERLRSLLDKSNDFRRQSDKRVFELAEKLRLRTEKENTLESEKDMNAELTAENERLKKLFKLIDAKGDLDFDSKGWELYDEVKQTLGGITEDE